MKSKNWSIVRAATQLFLPSWYKKVLFKDSEEYVLKMFDKHVRRTRYDFAC